MSTAHQPLASCTGQLLLHQCLELLLLFANKPEPRAHLYCLLCVWDCLGPIRSRVNQIQPSKGQPKSPYNHKGAENQSESRMDRFCRPLVVVCSHYEQPSILHRLGRVKGVEVRILPSGGAPCANLGFPLTGMVSAVSLESHHLLGS